MGKLMIAFAAMAATFAVVAAEAEKVASKETLKGNISLSGAWALYPMAVKWGEEFQKIHPGVKVDIAAGGAGKGMADALSGVVDLGMVSREIYPEEVKKGAWSVPVTKDAVAGTINRDNPFAGSLLKNGVKRDVLAGMWITEKVTDWKQVAGGDRSAEIHVYTRSDACGAAETWAKYLGKKQEDLEGVGVYGDPGLAEAVRKDPLGVGYNNVNYLYDNKTLKPVAGLLALPLDVNGNGKLDPEENFYRDRDSLIKAINDGKYPSPPARDLYLVSHGKPTKKETLAFLKWILTEGQKYAPEAGYIRLTDEKIAAALKKME